MIIEQEKYNFILSNIPIVCVDPVIYYKDSVLLVKRNTDPAKGQWWLPGGRVYFGENLVDASLRKAEQETGLFCKVKKFLTFGETKFEVGPLGEPIHTINFCYLLEAENKNVKLDSYHDEYIWVNHVPDGLHPYVVDSLSMFFGFEV